MLDNYLGGSGITVADIYVLGADVFGRDLALVHVVADLDATIMPFYSGMLSLGDIITSVGYGLSSAIGGTPALDGNVRAFQGEIDRFGFGATYFETPLQDIPGFGGVAGGDSGSPALIATAYGQQIVGMANYTGSAANPSGLEVDSGFLRFDGSTSGLGYLDEIHNITVEHSYDEANVFPYAAPEPSIGLLAVTGLMVSLRRRRERFATQG